MSESDDQQAEEQQIAESDGETPEDFEEWVEDQDEAVQKLYVQHTSGLKSALDTERETRRDLEDRVSELADQAEEGSEAKAELENLRDQMETENQKVQFQQDAHSAGVTNLELAWVAARENEMFDRRGNVDFDALEEEFPELFGGTPAATDGKAGAGSQTEPPQQPDMNNFIRTAGQRR